MQEINFLFREERWGKGGGDLPIITADIEGGLYS
jgi:hypothetical protein